MDSALRNGYGSKLEKMGISACDRLRRRIHEHHLSYLGRDDTPEKLEIKTKLESLIVDYLSIVPHSQKFSHLEVLNCLNKSVAANPTFSAYRAANAFEILEKFAINLLTKPWRKEYHVIYPYSGYYRQMVDKALIDGKQILFIMGYEQKQVPQTIFRLIDAPLDPDRLAAVALDCLIAFVECQIIIQVRDALKRKEINTTYFDIFDIRVRYVCGMDDVVRFVTNINKAKLISQEEGLIPLSSKYSRNSTQGQNGWSYPHIHPSLNMPKNPLKTNCHNDQYLPCEPSDIIQIPHVNHKSPHVGYPDMNSSPYVNPPSMFAGTTNYPSSQPLQNHSPHEIINRNTQPDRFNDINPINQCNNYRKSEMSSRQPIKVHLDHGQSSKIIEPVQTKRSPLNGSEKLNSLVAKTRLIEEELSNNSEPKGLIENGTTKISDTLSFVDHTIKTPLNQGKGAILGESVVDSLGPIGTQNRVKRWSCVTCTYLNPGNREICEICSRSRDTGPESAPLVSGGRECPVCTLVNDKNVDYCTVCETSLADSPTYI